MYDTSVSGLTAPEEPDERLLTDEKIAQACRDGFVWYPIISTADREIAKAQLALDLKFEEEWQADFTDKIATKYEKRVAEIEAKWRQILRDTITMKDAEITKLKIALAKALDKS